MKKSIITLLLLLSGCDTAANNTPANGGTSQKPDVPQLQMKDIS